ncbi:serine hydrolase domain-containing protein [Rufibacter tibetensis]|uniref:serine hydrolase domain-containing protein n=1 Tax=Rufibacter tibetensis TaxID=512763 RepID=UPI0007864863|nr:serine hydrolase domain-containing protein [Rufibacter tibetensis]
MKTILFCGFFFIAISLKAQEFQTKKMDSLFFLLEKYDKAMGSLSVYHKGERIYQKAIGYSDVDEKIKATVNTKYRIGSLSKMFTATLVMQLIEEGKLSLETKLSKFYPELPNSDQITIQHLLQHTSGIYDIIKTQNFKEWMVEKRSKDELLSKIKENSSLFSPGEKRDYSNTNYIILTFILEDIENKDFAKILEKRILKPLKLRNTYYWEKPDPKNLESSSYEKKDSVWEKPSHIHLSIPRGAGGIISTPEDLNKFINGLFDGKLVNENSLAIMKKQPGIGMYPIPFLKEEEMIGHTGGMDAFRSLLVYLPKQDMSLAFSFNGVGYSSKELLEGILKIVSNKEYDFPQFDSVNSGENR